MSFKIYLRNSTIQVGINVNIQNNNLKDNTKTSKDIILIWLELSWLAMSTTGIDI